MSADAQVPSPELNDERTCSGDAVTAGVLDRADVQDLRAVGRELEHLLARDCVELARVGHDARVGGEDAVDVGVDLADVGVERRGERDGGRVGAAAAERRDVAGVAVEALEAGDDRRSRPRRAPREAGPGVTSTMRAAPCVASVIMPAWLPVKERASKPMLWIAIASSAIEMRSPLESSMSSSRGRGHRRDLCGEVEQLVGACRPSRDTATTTSLPGLAGLDDALGDALDALGVGDGRPAVLLDDQAHVVSRGESLAPA